MRLQVALALECLHANIALVYRLSRMRTHMGVELAARLHVSAADGASTVENVAVHRANVVREMLGYKVLLVATAALVFLLVLHVCLSPGKAFGLGLRW